MLYPFIRHASVEAGVPRTGNWFCGLGATQHDLAMTKRWPPTRLAAVTDTLVPTACANRCDRSAANPAA